MTYGSSGGQGTAAAAHAAASTAVDPSAADGAGCDPMASATGHEGSRSQPMKFPSSSATNVVEGATLQNQDEQGVNTKPMAHPKAQAKRSKQKRNVKMFFTRG